MNVKISDIENSENKLQRIHFCEIYEEFNKEIPAEADLTVKINGEIIEISGEIKAVLTLTCDNCLKEYNQEIKVKVKEFFTKNAMEEKYSEEYEIKKDGFIEDLNGKDEIDITDFVYQTVIINIPNKCVCGINCKGEENLKKYIKDEITDPRLEIFKRIKIEKDN